MPLADYAHWNEDAPRVWWEEEGKHYDSDYETWRDEEMDAAQAFAEELGEQDDDHLLELIEDEDYLARWPKAKPIIEWELKYRGLR